MKRIAICAGEARYEALVGSGLLARLGDEVAKIFSPRRCAVIADEQTGVLFGETVLRSLRENGFAPVLITVPAGETAKSLEVAGRVAVEMTAAQIDRSSFVVGLGGGATGDVAGFVAAIYHRGIPHVQVPTTLLAQVDSSIGGKTGVNTAAGKNLLGAVHQPALVIADVETLRTLSAREFKQGFAEMIKHAIIADPGLLDVLERYRDDDLVELVARNIALKAAVVAADERDLSGERATLNFGHTVGHAIERVAGYGTFLHGEAISLGIVVACDVSVRVAGFPLAERERVIATLHGFDLPTRLPDGFPREQIFSALQADKKFKRGEVRFVVASKLGSVRLTNEVTLNEIAAAVTAL